MASFNIPVQLFFVLFAVVFLFTIGRSILQWHKNNNSPRLTVPAQVVAKRTNVQSYNDDGVMSSNTSYYATFQLENGERMELCIKGREYGLLAQGDFGHLTFQGTRYLGFERI